jgi:hypothetical protein
MDIQEVRQAVSEARDSITAKRVFGKPYEQDGVVVIPAAKVIGGGGGGGGEQGDGSGGAGFGFGLGGQPVGAYVIKNGKVRWKPALDLNAIVLRGRRSRSLPCSWRRRSPGGGATGGGISAAPRPCRHPSARVR